MPRLSFQNGREPFIAGPVKLVFRKPQERETILLLTHGAGPEREVASVRWRIVGHEAPADQGEDQHVQGRGSDHGYSQR